ncbi:hypothetical protein CW745_15020 [Psychromonas sp. psych-6C06]|uniref:hypothetical protein n=1 Tax=Psychromonas sp. psych-6C06 TaxID=2058089 RepID=UPI000C341CAA|nr:hypothetical protein [Psychromonas sp. psych-6C06]PKF60377.1 hypothetical protein CW745_15020 [Psychromonas sp. psych-6C06]
MPQYQLFVHEENKGLTYLEANTETYNQEKEQLLGQGFIIDTNYYIQAKSGAEALAQYGDITTEALYNYAPTVISAQGAVESTGLNLWNTKALATKIKKDLLSETEWKNYYLAGSLIITISIYVASLFPRENTLSILIEAILMIGIFIFGINTTFTTHKNNGKPVCNYIAKMVSLFVPLTIKFIIFSFSVGFAIGMAEVSGLPPFFADWVFVVLNVAVQALIFWRLNVHLHSINS